MSSRSVKRRRECQTIEEVYKLEFKKSEKEHFFEAIKLLYHQKVLCDITFKVGHETFEAHKILLVAKNSYFNAMMLSGMIESGQTQIDLPGDPIHFRFILEYLYGIPVEFPFSQIIPMLGVSSLYSVHSLQDRLAEILANKLSIDNCCEVFAAADRYGCLNLKNQAQDIIFSNFASASKTVGFYELSKELVEYVIDSDEIQDCDEAMLFEATIRWLEYKPLEREEACQLLLSRVRFPLMDSCLLSDVIKQHKYMKSPEQSALLFEAFEHHALIAAGRSEGLISAAVSSISKRLRRRKQSCSFTRSTLLNGHQDAVSALISFGDWLVSGSWDSSIKVWSTDNWLCIRTLSDHVGAIRGLCVCNGKLVSCSDDGVIKVWSPGSWTCVRSMEGHDGAANALVQCKGRLASAGDDGTIKLWGSTSWACEVTVHHIASPSRLAAQDIAEENANSHGGVRATQSRHDRRRLGSEDGGAEELAINPDPDEEASTAIRVGVMSMEVFEDKLISGGDDSVIRIWNTNNWNCERVLSAHQDEVWAIKINLDGTMVTGLPDYFDCLDCEERLTNHSASVDGTIRTWKQALMRDQLHQLHGDRDLLMDSNGDASHSSTSSSNDYRDSTESQSQFSGVANQQVLDWACDYTMVSDGSVYALCCFDGKVVSAGASNKISIWKSSMERESNATVYGSMKRSCSVGGHLSMSPSVASSRLSNHPLELQGPSSSQPSPVRSSLTNNSVQTAAIKVNTSLHKWFETEEAGVWSLAVCKGRLISGGVDGTVRVWT